MPGAEAWGWAGAVICDRGRKYYSAPGKIRVRDSNDAELLAIANVLHCGIRDGLIKEGDSLLIQCDNTHAGAIFNWHFGSARYKDAGPIGRRLPRMSIAQHQAVDFLKTTLRHTPMRRAHVRHIKSHLSYYTRRKNNHVHERVDQLAGQASRSANHARHPHI